MLGLPLATLGWFVFAGLCILAGSLIMISDKRARSRREQRPDVGLDELLTTRVPVPGYREAGELFIPTEDRPVEDRPSGDRGGDDHD